MRSTDGTDEAASVSPALRILPVGLLLGLLYFVVLGEAAFRDPPLVLKVVNAMAAAGLLVGYITLASQSADRIDRGVLASLLLFSAAGVLASFPRQAFDAVLTAFVYAAALYLARTTLAVEHWRMWFVRSLWGLSALLTFLTAARFMPPFLEWWSLTGWSVVPPLNMEFAASPWGHRHDLTLLLVMLYPSWWVGQPSPRRAAFATVVGILVLAIVVVDGSRALWIALVASTAITGAIVAVRHRDGIRRNCRRIGVAGVVVVAGIVVLAVTGAVGLLAERAFSTTSLGMRQEMWGPLVQAWLSHPVAGFGPGSFPWILQTTPYFDTNSLAPRHPDSAIVQALAEGGVLGLASVVVLLATLGPAVIRGRSIAATWVLGVFVLASLAANPTDFGFMVAVAIAWTAFAAPRKASPEPECRTGSRFPGRRTLRAASFVAFGVIAIASGAILIGDAAYQAGRNAARAGEPTDAKAAFELAHQFDPGMALYTRQLAVLQLMSGSPNDALELALQAAESNPSDDVAWRVVALAAAAGNDPATAEWAIDQALARQRSDPANLLLAARIRLEAGDHDAAEALLAEVVQAWPEVVAAPGWSDLLPSGVSTLDVVDLALQRWTAGEPSPEPRAVQPITLALMAGQTDLANHLAEDELGPSLGAAYVAVLTCRTDAMERLEAVPLPERRSPVYWNLVQRAGMLAGNSEDRAARLLQIMTGADAAATLVDDVITPTNENDRGYSADHWGYRRLSLRWPPDQSLPRPDAGLARWFVAPREAVADAGLSETLPDCQ